MFRPGPYISHGEHGREQRDHPAELLDNASIRRLDLGDSLSFESCSLKGSDLSETALQGANLSGANLSDADLSNANLREANLSGANLGGATLRGTNLERADLSEAHVVARGLSEATLVGVDLSDATLGGVDLSGADLRHADLSGADLQSADLQETNLAGADLSEADLGYYEPPPDVGADGLETTDLSDANIEQADLSGATLEMADLSGATIVEAGLSRADLSRANLSGVDLSGATLQEANLIHADLRGADLTGADLWGSDVEVLDLRGATLEGADLSGTNLGEAIRSEADLCPEVATCPACGEDLTTYSPDEHPFCPNCWVHLKKAVERDSDLETGAGTDTATPGLGETRGDPLRHPLERPEGRVVLVVMGHEIHARDGDRIGREIRTAMAQEGAAAGALDVHRKHARLDREGDTYYVTRLEEKGLSVNGVSVGKHERVPISDGDELQFAGAVTAHVRIA